MTTFESIFFFVSLLVFILRPVLLFLFQTSEKQSFVDKTREIDTSILLCCKNEAPNLRNILPLLLKQSHSSFEILCIDHDSQDETKKVIEYFADRDQRVKYVFCPSDKVLKGKRAALWEGFKQAKGTVCLMIDADCVPSSESWLQKMTSQLDEKEIIIGISPVLKEKGFTNFLHSFDVFNTTHTYIGFAQRGMPFMVTGRNYAIKKNLVSERVFQSHNQTLSGDDDLVIGSLLRSHSCGIEIDKEGRTLSKSYSSLRKFLKAKSRHVGTARYYPMPVKTILLLLNFTHLLVYLLILGLVVLGIEPFLGVLAFSITHVFSLITLKRNSKSLKIYFSFGEIAIGDLCLTLLNLVLIKDLFKKDTAWK